MSDQPPDAKVVKLEDQDVTVPEVVKPKRYYVPNRHDRRKAAAIQRKEEREKRKNGQG